MDVTISFEPTFFQNPILAEQLEHDIGHVTVDRKVNGGCTESGSYRRLWDLVTFQIGFIYGLLLDVFMCCGVFNDCDDWLLVKVQQNWKRGKGSEWSQLFEEKFTFSRERSLFFATIDRPSVPPENHVLRAPLPPFRKYYSPTPRPVDKYFCWTRWNLALFRFLRILCWK